MEKKSDKQVAMGYKNPEKALRVHIEDDDKVVNKMDTTYGIKPPPSSTNPASTPLSSLPSY